MKINKASSVLVLLAFSVLLVAGPVYANKSSVTIDAPESAAKGSEITIKVNVSHKGNGRFHHTDFVYIKINGKEIKRWEFTASERPESENFSMEIKYRVEEKIEIIAEANCNLHGSAGVAKKIVEIK